MLYELSLIHSIFQLSIYLSNESHHIHTAPPKQRGGYTENTALFGFNKLAVALTSEYVYKYYFNDIIIIYVICDSYTWSNSND